MRIRQLNHSTYAVEYHLIWGTKCRYEILQAYTKTELIRSFILVQKKYPSWYIHTVNTDRDHIHLLVEFPPSFTIAEVVRKIKVVSSLTLKRKFRYIRKAYPKGSVWSTGYYVSTVGVSDSTIRKYITNQGKKDFERDVTAVFS
jgi:putative transposase